MVNDTLTASRISTIGQALQWQEHVPPTERLVYCQKLVNLRREYRKTGYALAERPSVAAFGESQMGKSYLVSALLSTSNAPFKVTDGERAYHFIDEINPSSPNSTIEATGVITRFTTQPQHLPAGVLGVQLLSVADVLLVLCEAYYNQVDYSYESIKSHEQINEILSAVTPGSATHPFLSEDELLDVKEYLQNTSRQKKCHALLTSDSFDFLLMRLKQLTQDQLTSLLKLMWNDNQEMSRLFDDLMATYTKLNFANTVRVDFACVLKKHGTLLDVARLDEMYAAPEVAVSEYQPDVTVTIDAGTRHAVTVPKSFFSALIAELTFELPPQLAQSRAFLKDIDILDFPGARRPEQISETKLALGKNLSTVFRRGKVSYLFSKYSTSKRITALLFCHNNNQSAESTIGGVLTKWVHNNVGETAAKREQFIVQSQVSPLLVVATWFNKDLDYQNENKDEPDRLSERWQRRFNVVLEKEVLKASDPDHWLNAWTTSQPDFDNIFMLRDFKYSTSIFSGYDADAGLAEREVIVNEKYPDFLLDLRASFVNDSFVKHHIPNSEQAWDAAATVGNDGSRLIIDTLCHIAPHAAGARNKKLTSDLTTLDRRLLTLLDTYHQAEDGDVKLKQAKKQAGDACLHIDRQLGKDAYFFGRLKHALMISETELYELIHSQILGAELPQEMTDEESGIFLAAGLDAGGTRERNIETLCEYLGCDSEEECRDTLLEQGIELSHLLAQQKIASSEEDQLMTTIEKRWHDDFLATRCVTHLANAYPPIDLVVRKLWAVYRMLGMHEKLSRQVGYFLKNLNREQSVGIIADLVTMRLNAFVDSFGYDFIAPEGRARILQSNDRLRLGIDASMLDRNANEGIALLADLDKKSELLAAEGFSKQGKQFLSRFPQYQSVWRWEQQLRFAFAFACELPDYDPVANASLGQIIAGVR